MTAKSAERDVAISELANHLERDLDRKRLYPMGRCTAKGLRDIP
ncbi:hypothetical protein [Pseudomonas savastanoi]|nr:hypothetical protein [Pseudomonas savastanoi]RMM89277.1 hypothetical protein ALQ69_01263 [Pseudomonas savastanoi pv. glycinea]